MAKNRRIPQLFSITVATVVFTSVFALAGLSMLSASHNHAAYALGTNGKIAFTSERDGNLEIYVMNADGADQTRLTNSGEADQDPSWSPDGTEIAFASVRDGNWEIYVTSAHGVGQTRLTNNFAVDFTPSWSPDGTKIAFTSERDGNREIYIMNADGTGQTNLTNNPAVDFRPSWSPDGTKIAFGSDRDGSAEIYVMNADGTDATNLTNNNIDDFLPSWSPDGTKIAFTSGRDNNLEIYVMNADGTGQTNLTNNPTDDYLPSWSPDGTKIAFGSDRDANREIYVMNADGTGQTNLTNNPSLDTLPDFGPSTDYSLNLFENTHDQSDGVIGLNQEARALAETTNAAVDQVTFKWINPTGNTVRTQVVPLSLGSAEDTFAPDELGEWIVEADFANGVIIQKILDISFNVIPESPVGTLALIGSSMAALMFYGIRGLYKRKQINP